MSEPCSKCGMSELYIQITEGWNCVCDLLIENGNCPECLFLPEKCKCVTKIVVQTPEPEETSK